MFDGLNKNTKKLSNLMIDHVEKAADFGKFDAEFLKYINHLLAFGTDKHSALIFKTEKEYDEDYIRYYAIFQKIEKLYKAKVT